MATRSQKMQLGVFLLVAIVLFLGAFIVLTGAQFWETRNEYVIRFSESVSGLEVGAAVKLRGVRVGGVTKIQIAPDNVEQVEVYISVQEHTPIRSDTEAVITTQGITGMKFIELMGGTEEGQALPSGSEIQAGRSILDQLSGQASDMGVKADLLLTNLLNITRPENQLRVDSILAGVDEFLGNLNQLTREITATTILVQALMEDNRVPLRRAIVGLGETNTQVQHASVRVGAMVDQINQTIARMHLPQAMAEMRRTNSVFQAKMVELDISELMVDVTTALSTLHVMLESVTQTMNQNQDQIRATLYNLRLATDSLKEFSRSLERQPSRLLFDDHPKDRELPK